MDPLTILRFSAIRHSSLFDCRTGGSMRPGKFRNTAGLALSIGGGSFAEFITPTIH